MQCVSRPLYRTGHVVESNFSGPPSIQVRPSYCDECAPNTRSIVGLDFCDVGNLEEHNRFPRLNTF